MAELGYSLFRYIDSEGQFDYAKYVSNQVEANRRKINCVWVQESNVEFLSGYIKKFIDTPRIGLCHGTRRGLEQQWFKKHMECEVIGTEISDTATEFPDTIQWDFHQVKSEWVGAIDFIYSNSFDHSYDPEKCINAWASCLNDRGMIVLEHSVGADDKEGRESDPFAAPLAAMPFLILMWGAGNFSVREIIRAPERAKWNNTEYETYFLIIKNNV